MSRRSALLGRGYLPENLPPLFVSTRFGDFADRERLASDWVTQQRDRTRPAPYNATKRGHQRRLFGIPNPFSALDTSLFIDRHWPDIQEHLSRSPFSLSTPVFDEHTDRAVAITPHNEIPFHKARRLARSRYVVRTDISRFFPSIYSHALPWSYHGKPASKRDRRIDSEELFFNRLDFCTRQGQDGQTIGLPVGPDTSRIIAEIVATAVDIRFQMNCKGRPPAMVRHVDDIWIGAHSPDEAESFLYTYRECLREFELDINELKTSVVRATDDIADFWPVEIKEMLRTYFGTDGSNAEDQMIVLDRIFQMAKANRDDGVVKFALRRFDKLRAWSYHWNILAPFLERCAVNFPHCIDYVARVIAWRNRVGGEIGIEGVGEFLNEMLAFHSRLASDSEVTWGLWLARELSVKVQSQVGDMIAARCGPLTLMGLYDCVERGVFERKPRGNDILERVGEAALLGPLWIFAYTAIQKSWVRGLKSQLRASPEVFPLMIRKDVIFHDEDALPSALEGKDEEEWTDVEAIGDVGGLYDGDEEDDEDEEVDF